MSRLAVREARSEELHRLARSTLESLPPEVASAGSYQPRRTERLLDADVVFVAELDGHPAGHVAVRQEPEAMVVDQLVVDEVSQGLGVGNRLLDWVEGYALSRGAPRVRIEVEDGNERAQEFYRRRGVRLRRGHRRAQRPLGGLRCRPAGGQSCRANFVAKCSRSCRTRPPTPRSSTSFSQRVLPDHARVLDAGCGRTTRLWEYQARIDVLVGVDVDMPAGRENSSLDRFEVCDLCTSLPFPDGSFDLVYANFVVEHLTVPQRAFAEWRRVLAPGGRCCC